MNYGKSVLEMGHWIYAGPRWLSPLTRFAWGRRLLKRYYRLWFIGEMQAEMNLHYSNYVDHHAGV